MAKRRGTKTVTKKHLARLEREQRQRRIILISSVVVLLIVVVLIGYGIIEQAVIEPNQPVAMVDEEKITTADFQNRVKYQRRQLVQQYLGTYQNMQMFGEDENTQAFFQQSLNQIEFQLDPVTLGQQTLETMIDDVIIRQEAERRGIDVTDEEVDKYLEEAIGYFEGGTPPTQTPVPTSLPTSTLSPTQLALIPPTTTPTATTTPTTTKTTSTPEGTDLEPSEPTSTVTELPTPTPFTYEAYQELYNQVLTSFEEDISLSEKELRDILINELYRQKVKDVILVDIKCEQDQVWARHILVEDEETAQEVLTKLKSGEDFPLLAAQYSTDESNKDNGGDLGWFSVGRMVPEFEQVAFNLNVSQISEPVETQFGWHIIQTLGHEVRPLSALECNQFKDQEFTNWLEQQKLISSIERFDYWRERVPTEPSIPPNLTQF